MGALSDGAAVPADSRRTHASSQAAGYLLGVLGTGLVLLVLLVVAVVVIGALVLSGSTSP